MDTGIATLSLQVTAGDIATVLGLPAIVANIKAVYCSEEKHCMLIYTKLDGCGNQISGCLGIHGSIECWEWDYQSKPMWAGNGIMRSIWFWNGTTESILCWEWDYWCLRMGPSTHCLLHLIAGWSWRQPLSLSAVGWLPCCPWRRHARVASSHSGERTMEPLLRTPLK